MTDALTMKPIDTEAWDPSLKHVVDDMHGAPLNIHKMLANNPALLDAWWAFRKYSVNGGSLGKRNAEIVILRTAVNLDCWYEWASHVVRGLDSGLSLEEIEAVRTGGDWDDADALLIAAVDELDQHRALHADSLQALSEFFSGQQVLDLFCLVNTYNMLGCVLNSWPVSLDEPVSDALPAGVSEGEFSAAQHGAGQAS